MWGKLEQLYMTKALPNNLEFCNNEFDDYYSKNSISKHHTRLNTPQQIGLAERINRIIMNKVKCMLFQSGMPTRFWAKAASTACYLINMSPSSALCFKVPNEVWSSFKPSYKHLRLFGSLA